MILKSKFSYLLVGLVIILMSWIGSFWFRYYDFTLPTGIPNLEAPYHALLTIKSFDESPMKEHYFLPTINLGGEFNKNIKWGATLQLKSGHFVYTSFTSMGFFVPFVFLKYLKSTHL